MLHLPPPGPLDFSSNNLPEAWEQWKQCWDLYAVDSSVVTKDEKLQCAIFLCAIGSEGIEIFNKFRFKNHDQDTLQSIIDQINLYCTQQHNEVYLRYKFNTRRQLPNETIDQFVTDLKILAEPCGYGKMRDDMIIVGLIGGIADEALRDRLLDVGDDLDLVKATEMCREEEISESISSL